ncbi:MAG: phage tail protein [Tetragenococcus koreensis]|nr:phage tail protein [Tetragenococcus koreensis]
MEKVIDVHNGDLEPHQRFKLGNVTVTNSTDNIYGFIGYGDTYSEIKENFIDRFGGYLSVREEPDGTYLDYLADDPPLKNTKISIRGNLREFRRELDPTEIKTRIIPLGARIEPAEGEESYVSMPRIDAKSVNNDKDYFDDEALRQEFGIIVGKLEYDDIHDPQYLPLRADQFFQNQKAAKVSYQVSALQTYLTDNEVDELEVGYRYPVSTAPAFNIEEELEIIAMQISSDRPQRPDLTIGEQYKTLSQYQADANRQRLTVQQLEERISSLGNKNVQLSQSLDEAKSSVTQLKTALQYNDDTGISIALNDIDETLEILKGDLDSIPIATQTSNGLMSITDKIKLDGLQNYSIATEAADGLLSAVDKTKLNKLENYDVVTATTNGLMAAADKTALDKVATGVGDITLLATAEKTDLVLAINELTNRVATLEGGS